MSRNEILRNAIFALSFEQKDWEGACQEWELVRVEVARHKSNCLCGQEIVYEYRICNTFSGGKAIVGSSCIINFMQSNKRLVGEVREEERRRARERAGRVENNCVHCGRHVRGKSRLHYRCRESYYDSLRNRALREFEARYA